MDTDAMANMAAMVNMERTNRMDTTARTVAMVRMQAVPMPIKTIHL